MHADVTGGDRDTTAPPPPGAGAGDGAPARRLVRVEQGRVLAGVAGGAGAFLQIDPRVLRVVFVLATLFGGVGVLAYLAAWAVVPSASAADSPAERVLRRFSSAPTAVQVVVVGLVVLVFGAGASSGRPGFGWGTVLVTGGFLLLRQDTGRQQRAIEAQAPALVTAPPALVTAPPALVTAPPALPLPAPAPQVAAAPPVTAPSPAPPHPGAQPPMQPGAGSYGSYRVEPRTASPSPPRPVQPASYLGRLTVATLLVVLGVMALLDAVGLVELRALGYLCLALGTVGVGLLIGARAGRARWLIPLGLVLAPPLLLLAAAPVLPSFTQAVEDLAADAGGVGERRAAPTTLAEVRDRYQLAAGTLELDLSAVAFTADPTRVEVEVGVGDVVVVVPHDVRVDLTGTVGGGKVMALGTYVEGVDEVDLGKLDVDEGPEGGGRLRLDLLVGGGTVSVLRAGDQP